MRLKIVKYDDLIYLDIADTATILTLKKRGMSLWSFYGLAERGIQCDEEDKIKVENCDE